MKLENYIILILLILLFDTLGAHMYSKITMLITIIYMIHNLKNDSINTKYNIINLNEEHKENEENEDIEL